MGSPDLWYPSFTFEGQSVPTVHALPDALSARDTSLFWVRAAVSNPVFAHAVISIADGWLDHASAFKRALSLHYLRALGARGCCERVSKTLTQRPYDWLFIINPLFELNEEARPLMEDSTSEDGVSFFPPRKIYFVEETLAETALQLLITLCPPQHIARESAIDWALTEPSLTVWAWDAWAPQRAHLPLLQSALKVLNESEEWCEALALRLALFHPQEAPIFCEHLKALHSPQKHIFERTLEKQLRRVGKIKLWVHCRKSLLRGPN
jgi:hypothetical protein